MAEHGQSLRTYYVLASLRELDGLSQQQLGDRIGVDRSDMVRLIDELEGLGQVERARHPSDRRRYRLTLTPRGHKTLVRCEETLAAVTDHVFAALSTDERRTLHRLTLRALRQREEIADLLEAPISEAPARSA